MQTVSAPLRTQLYMKARTRMFRSWKLGTAFGIGIWVHWTFLLLPAWVFLDHLSDGVGYQLAFYAASLLLAVFGCVVLHELGHALMARRFGIRTRDITLYPIGGVARLERMSERPWEEFWIAVAGPAVNVVIACVLAGFLLLGSGDASAEPTLPTLPGSRFFLDLLVANAALVLFNMLPAFPMDGGRILRALLSTFMGRLRATQIAVALGAVLALLLPLASMFLMGGFNPMLLFIGFFVFLAGQQELAMVRFQEAQRATGNVVPGTVELHEPDLDAPAPNFSGVRWDGQAHAWVLFRDGRPVRMIWVK